MSVLARRGARERHIAVGEAERHRARARAAETENIGAIQLDRLLEAAERGDDARFLRLAFGESWHGRAFSRGHRAGECGLRSKESLSEISRRDARNPATYRFSW